jgi:hypothetical protein
MVAAQTLLVSTTDEARTLIGQLATDAQAVIGQAATEAQAVLGHAATEAQAVLGHAATEAQAVISHSATEATAVLGEKLKAGWVSIEAAGERAKTRLIKQDLRDVLNWKDPYTAGEVTCSQSARTVLECRERLVYNNKYFSFIVRPY